MICENMSIWCWLIPAIVGLICAILGYLLGRLSGKNTKLDDLEAKYNNAISKLEADLAACKQSNTKLGNSEENDKKIISKLEEDLAACKASKTNSGNLEEKDKNETSKLETDLATSKTSKKETPVASRASKEAKSNSSSASVSTFDTTAAKLVFGKKIKENDLKVVVGIGPKIEGLFHNFDVKTWKALSECSIDKCQEVLNSGGERYRMHKPGTWPKQAGLASQGKWKELLKWQKELDKGK